MLYAVNVNATQCVVLVSMCVGRPKNVHVHTTHAMGLLLLQVVATSSPFCV